MARSIKDVIAGGGLKTFMDRRLISALSHPVREHVLAVVNERPASPAEVGREIGLEVPAFYHHVEVLEQLGCIEQVETQRRRGVKEHFFQATATMLFSDREWQKFPGSVRSDIIASHIRSIMGELARALRSGAFREKETHTTWLPGIFDGLGWQEVMALMNETLARLMDIQNNPANGWRSRTSRGFQGPSPCWGSVPRRWTQALSSTQARARPAPWHGRTPRQASVR
jgi:DNA-binding transcriptional ArsR family regulator